MSAIERFADVACVMPTMCATSTPSPAGTPLDSLTAGEGAAVTALLSASHMAHQKQDPAIVPRPETLQPIPMQYYYPPAQQMIVHPQQPSLRPAIAQGEYAYQAAAWAAAGHAPYDGYDYAYAHPAYAHHHHHHHHPTAAVLAPSVAPVLGKRGPPTQAYPGHHHVPMPLMSHTKKSGTKRARYDDEFKEQVVREAMLCPEGARIKPTCSRYPGVEPCQLRKWIQKFSPLLKVL